MRPHYWVLAARGKGFHFDRFVPGAQFSRGTWNYPAPWPAPEMAPRTLSLSALAHMDACSLFLAHDGWTFLALDFNFHSSICSTLEPTQRRQPVSYRAPRLGAIKGCDRFWRENGSGSTTHRGARHMLIAVEFQLRRRTGQRLDASIGRELEGNGGGACS